MADAASNHELLADIKRLTERLLHQVDAAYGDLRPIRPQERKAARDGYLFAEHVERFFRDASERARNVKEMLEITPEDEEAWKRFGHGEGTEPDV